MVSEPNRETQGGPLAFWRYMEGSLQIPDILYIGQSLYKGTSYSSQFSQSVLSVLSVSSVSSVSQFSHWHSDGGEYAVETSRGRESQGDPKGDLNWIQEGSPRGRKVVPKWIQKGTKMGSPFGPKGDQNGTPFWPKRGPDLGRIKSRPGSGPGRKP